MEVAFMPRTQNLIGTERLPKMSVGKAPDSFHNTSTDTAQSPGPCYSRSLYLQVRSDTLETECFPVPGLQAVTPSPKTLGPWCRNLRRVRKGSTMVPSKLTIDA